VARFTRAPLRADYPTAGFVCACAPYAATASSSAANVTLIIPGISISLFDVVFC
jgi:hypothetical protein